MLFPQAAISIQFFFLFTAAFHRADFALRVFGFFPYLLCHSTAIFAHQFGLIFFHSKAVLSELNILMLNGCLAKRFKASVVVVESLVRLIRTQSKLISVRLTK